MQSPKNRIKCDDNNNPSIAAQEPRPTTLGNNGLRLHPRFRHLHAASVPLSLMRG